MEKDEMLTALKSELENFKKSLPEGVSKTEIEDKFKEFSTELNKKFEGLSVEKVSELEAVIKAQGLEITALKETGGKPDAIKTVKEILAENEEALKTVDSSSKGKASFTIPLAAVNKTTVTPASFTTDYSGARIPGYGQKATKRLKVASLFSQFPLGADNRGVIYYTDQTTTTRNAAARNVGDAAGESVLAFTGFSQKLECITDTLPVAKEMLSRYDLLEAEINNFVTNNLLLKEDADLVSGDGNSPNIKGIYTYATAFNSGAYTGFKPAKAALMDLIMVMATEIEKNTQYMVDTVLINPADALGLSLEKDADGVRINFPFLMANGEMSIRNIRIVESASVTAGTMVIGDFTKARRYFGDSILLEMGYNTSGDFSKRIVTILAQIDELLLVRNCEADAFLKSTDIATDITNITAATT